MSSLPFGQHVAVVGLGFGDEGKGTITDYLTSAFDYDLVVKSSGATQCAHHVTREDGITHRFVQFGAGTFNGARTHLSKFFLVDPLRLNAEGNALVDLGVENAFDLISVSEQCRITTPFHAAANQVKEIARGADAHGSCGLGVGETMAYDIEYGGPRVKDCWLYENIHERLVRMRDIYAELLGDAFLDHELVRRYSTAELAQAYFEFRNEITTLNSPYADSLIDTSNVVFEGSQGVLLDEWHGTHPYTTWSTTTFTNACHLTPKPVFRLGVLRTYTTRHGAGPFPTEVDPETMPEELHNGTGRFQGAWRAGHFDAVLGRYAVGVCGRVDGLAITHLDVTPPGFCNSYEVDGMAVHDLLVKRPWEHMDLSINERMTRNLERARPVLQEWPQGDGYAQDTIGELLDVPVAIYSYGPTASRKRMSDTWGEWRFALSA